MKLPATTPEEIYQHYWRGPAAVLRLFEQVFGTLALYDPPPPDIQQSTIEALGQEIDRLKAQIARLQEQISRLHHHNFQLQRRNAELEAPFLKCLRDRTGWRSYCDVRKNYRSAPKL